MSTPDRAEVGDPAVPDRAAGVVPGAGPDRRGIAWSVGVCVLGAAVALFAASREWTETVTPRPAPLPPLHVPHTGGALLPWLPALALVGLAGAGALFACRRRVRSVVGVVIGLAGLGVVIAGVVGFSYAVGWSVLVVAGGLAIAWCGVETVRHGNRWPAMGARYERAPAKPADRPVTDVSMWDDLDRGVDPTANT